MDIEIVIPGKLGSRVMSRAHILEAVNAAGAGVKPVAGAEARAGLAHHDFGATAVAVLGTAAATAAAKGLFDLLKTIVTEAYKTRRLDMMQEHELRILRLRVGDRTHQIDLDQTEQEIETQLSRLHLAVEEGGA